MNFWNLTRKFLKFDERVTIVPSYRLAFIMCILLIFGSASCGKLGQKNQNSDPLAVVTGTESEALTEIQSRLKKEENVRKILKQTREVIQNLSSTVARFAKALDLLAPEIVGRGSSSNGLSEEIRKRFKSWVDVLNRSIEAPGKYSSSGSSQEWLFPFQLPVAFSSFCNTAQLQVIQLSNERNYLVNLKHCALPDFFEVASASIVENEELQLQIYPEAIEKFLKVATDSDGVKIWIGRNSKPLDACDLHVKGAKTSLKCQQLRFTSERASFVFETLEMSSREEGVKLKTHAKLLSNVDEVLATASMNYEQGKTLEAMICDSQKRCNLWSGTGHK